MLGFCWSWLKVYGSVMVPLTVYVISYIANCKLNLVLIGEDKVSWSALFYFYFYDGCRCGDWVHWGACRNVSWSAVSRWFPWGDDIF